ncbi:5'-Nucleotidase domain protein [Alkaliphilus metalliredigens QYMF]|uniref:5'-Nucleotidase domain protein n=1 Tax=Alkaliphilus metalliredigens (strain QYMF) TaxID=293826 RepID=A6TKQ1_ALKMQ|nr:bifunctional 2',3'-cyclic-nucleotide 2'-phosphodiesterase/3'-nucleotidase [Alkaliphilus metalliredigens]ABR46769.1 5'-Nucleotidase domain protein [Alkaliphilus metalliredigens QYMF]
MLQKGKRTCKKAFSRTTIMVLAFVLIFALVAVPQVSAAEKVVHELVIMGTTDIHSYIMPYDYLKDAEAPKIGLSKTATLVDQKRVQHANTLLFDAGDAIQGSMLAYLEAVVEPLKEGEVHSTINAMNIMEYDGAVIGNHEFDFGLDFLQRAHEDAQFPIVSANIYKVGTDETYFTPYVILDREVDGKAIKVGVIGFVPPQVTTWSKLHLEGKVEAREIVETAEKFIPMMREDGADLIIAVGHTGIDISENASENVGYQLSQVEGIDAMILGHQHRLFPSETYADMEGIDVEKGLINGVPTIMPGSWGNHLGLIKLELVHRDGVWEVIDSQSIVEGVEEVEAKPSIVEFVKERHTATIEYVNGAVGRTVANLNTFFGRVMDNKVTKLVNDAQLWYANNFFKGTEYEDANLISSTAPFKMGRQGPTYFTNVEAGGIAIKDVADIYIYDNTLHVVKVNGEELLQWIETAADNFEQIDPSKTEDQVLLDYAFAGYNFDVFTDIEYQIDVTQPSGSRVVNLSYEGEPVTAEMEFVVVTNNYRATGGGDHLKGAEIILSSTDENRNIIIDYIREMGEADPQEENNWSILPIETAGRLIFRSSLLGKDYIESEGLTNVSYIGEEEGWGLYTYNFPPVVATEEVIEPEVIQEEVVEVEVTIPEVVQEVVEESATLSETARVHVVQSGDNLWNIARKHYGSGTYYYQILEVNQEIINQAALIYPGQQLMLP